MHHNLSTLVKKYEEMSAQNISVFFDADQIEEIAYFYESKDDFTEALKVVNFGLSMYGGNSMLILLKAKYLLFLDYTDEAGMIINSITDESEETMLVKIEYQFAIGNPEAGFSILAGQLEKRDISWEFCMDAVNILWGYASFDKIIEFIKSAIKRHPASLELKLELATLYTDHNLEDMALDLYNQILDVEPFLHNVWFEQAKTYAQIRNFDKAVDCCDFALAISEDNKEILGFKGFCLYDNEKYTEALEVFKEYESLPVCDNSLFDYIADCYSKLDMAPKAIEYIESSLVKDPENPHFLFHLAFYYQDLGNTPKAREVLEQCIGINPDNMDYFRLMADIFRQEDNYESSLLYFKKVSEKEPSYDIFAQMGDCAEKLNDINLAIDYYNEALILRPTEIKIMFRLVLAYYSVNEPEKAITVSQNIDNTMIQMQNQRDLLSDEEKINLDETNKMISDIKKVLSELLGTEL